MAKQTGQITYPKNNQIVNFEEIVRFIFTKESGERITRDTTNKGVINFDIPNGDWNVSWFAVDGDQKVLPLRAGLQLKITDSTPPTALADWIYGDNTHVADPILTQWSDLLDEMKKVRDEFRDETSFVGTGNIVRESVTNRKADKFVRYLGGEHINNANEEGLFSVSSFRHVTEINGYPKGLVGTVVITVKRWGSTVLLQKLEDDVSVYVRKFTVTSPDVVVWNLIGKKDPMAVGDFGVGSDNPQHARFDDPEIDFSGFFSNFRGEIPEGMWNGSKAGVIFKRTKHITHYLYTGINGNLALSTKWGENWRHHNVFWSDANTVIDSNGNLKPASPVIQLHYDRVEYNEDFDKDNPPIFEHLETGVYRITNVREICKDGWTFNKPINSKSQPYFMIKYEQEDATTLLVRVFERTFNSKTGEFGFGEPRDIGSDERWIDFHFEVDHERIAREEAQMQKEQEEFEEQERLRKEAEELAEKEAQEAYEAEMAKQEAEMLAEMEVAQEIIKD